jgi:hypothetical protein
MKIEITEKGVYDAKGQPIPVGTEMNIKGDTLPSAFLNKARIIAEKPAKAEKVAAVTNPAGAAQPQGDTPPAGAQE